jgi:pimeloyl-ACP methyl ester carboxylesterase
MPIIEVSGHAVEYQQWGSGPDLVLVHSLLTDASVFDGIAPVLAASRRVTALNLPGDGASAARPLDSIAGYAAFLREAIDALALPASTDLFANGFGAFVATVFALDNPGRIRRLVVADVNAGFPEAGRIPFGMMAGKVTEGGMETVLDAAIGRMFPEPFQQANPAVAGYIAGQGGPVSVADSDGRLVNVSGEIILDAADIGRELTNPDGLTTARAIVQHELGHVVGLDHTSDRTQLMYSETNDEQPGDWGTGDLAGLHELGSGECRPDV